MQAAASGRSQTTQGQKEQKQQTEWTAMYECMD
jgi:hypothetical protein